MRQLLSSPIANKMRELRKRQGLTQKQMADILGINQSQYSKYERARQSISCCQICQLSSWFNIDPAWFFEGFRDLAQIKPVYSKTCSHIQE